MSSKTVIRQMSLSRQQVLKTASVTKPHTLRQRTFSSFTSSSIENKTKTETQQPEETNKQESQLYDEATAFRYQEGYNPHRYFYRVLAVPFFKVGLGSLACYYSLIYLWEYLESEESKSESTPEE